MARPRTCRHRRGCYSAPSATSYRVDYDDDKRDPDPIEAGNPRTLYLIAELDAGGGAWRYAQSTITLNALRVAHRRRHEILGRRVSSARLPTGHGDFNAHVYESLLDGVEHLALTLGEPGGVRPPLVRLHSECLTGDVLGSLRLRRPVGSGAGTDRAGAGWRLVYLRGHEGRGIGLGRKLAAYALQDRGRNTVEPNLDLGLHVDRQDYLARAHMTIPTSAIRRRKREK
jgi:hypothetical protein